MKKSRFYNEELKQRFISHYNNENTIHSLKSLFESIAKDEERIGMDVCEMDEENLLNLLDGIKKLRKSSIMTARGHLREYVKWCVESGVPGAKNIIESVDTSGIAATKEYMLANPQSLQLCLDEIFDPVEDKTVDVLLRCCMWLAFEGVKEENVYTIKKNDVCLENMEFYCSGKTYPIRPESFKTFRYAATLKSFVIHHPNYTKDAVKDRAAGEYLMTGTRGLLSTITIRTSITRKQIEAKEKENATVGKQLSFRRVRMSGAFYRAYERERAGLEVSFLEIVCEDMGVDITNDNIPEEKRKNVMRNKNRIEMDYERWKLAFSMR